MSSATQVETLTTGADKAKYAATALLVVGAVAAFYLLGAESIWLRVGALVVLLAAAVGTFFTSTAGQELIGFSKDSYKEMSKVVWPTGQEARQMTLYVFAFVVVMAIFLWLTDKSIEWAIFSLVLQWK
jgi:preprotein translocase subunit SecE